MKTTIRRGSYVTTNKEIKTVWNGIIPTNTKCVVYKCKRDGNVYVTPVDGTVFSGGFEVNVNDLTKLPDMKPKVNVGDIFDCSWGYEQTNVDFYQITAVLGKSVKYRKIGQTRHYEGPMNGRTSPVKNDFTSDERMARLRILTDGSVSFRITGYSSAYPWGGKPQMFSEWH